MDKLANLKNTEFANSIFLPLLNRILYINSFNSIYRNSPSLENIVVLMESALQQLDITLDFQKNDLEKIPKNGPVILISNHPSGILDGVILYYLTQLVRKDSKVIVSEISTILTPAVTPVSIIVNPWKNYQHEQNISGQKEALSFLENGGMLGIFPAGGVAHWQFKEGCITDSRWGKTTVRLAEATNAAVVPMYIHTKNSWYFQLAGILSPHLRTALIPQQFFNKKHSVCKIAIGNPIQFETIKAQGDAAKQIQYLRTRTYLLAQP